MKEYRNDNNVRFSGRALRWLLLALCLMLIVGGAAMADDPHEHTWGDWTKLDEDNHTRACVDGDETETEAHNWGSWANDDDNTHTRTCSVCGATQSENHEWSAWANADDNTHMRSCSVCGATQSENHAWSAWTNVDENTHTRSCSVCGATQTVNHNWGSWAKADDNTHTRSCSDCGTTQTEAHTGGTATCVSGPVCETCNAEYGAADSNAHNWGDWTVTTPATCTTKGEETHVCSRDSNHKETREISIDPNAHKLTAHEAVAATCTEAGNSAYWSCDYCGKYFSDASGSSAITENAWVISATGHNMTAYAATSATCTEAGNSAYWYCENCKKYFNDDQGTAEIKENSWVIAATGHKMTKHVEAVAATCTTAGNSEYWYCENCKKYFSDANGGAEIAEDSWVIKATGHNPEAHEAKDASCTEEGNSAYWYCKNCQKYFKDSDCKTEYEGDSWKIKAKGHTPKEAVRENEVAATCTTDGSYDEVVYCSVDGCNAEISRTHKTVPATGHDMTAYAANPASCTTAGNSAYWYCSACGKYFSDNEGKTEIAENSWVIPAGHTITKYDAVAPTVEKEGNIEYWYCSVCQKYFKDEKGESEYVNGWADVKLDKLTITGFEIVTPRNSTYKPAIEKAAALFPSPLNATLSDGTTLPVNLTWSCADYDTGYDRDYIFTATLAEGSPALGVDKDNKPVTAPTATLHVEPGKSGEYTYRLNDEGTATIFDWSGVETELIVPPTLADAPVTAIADGAFKDKITLTKLELPDGVKTIGENAFAGCIALTSVTLPDSLESLALTAFTDDTLLSSIVLRCNGNTTLNPANTINHDDAVDGVPAPVVLPDPYTFTDLTVATNADATVNGNLTVGCDFKLEAGHAIQVNAGTLTNNKTLTNLGTITVTTGTFNNAGSVLSCAGTVTGNIGGAGTYKANGSHTYADGVCTVCGAKLPSLSVKYNGKAISKTYDKTRNVSLKASDFSIVDTQGMDVSISGISASYDKADAGSRTVNVTLKLAGNDAAMFGNKVTTKVSATIEPKPLIITPTANQKKTYGAADPSYYTGKVRGLLSGDTVTGKLGRKAGEDVGKYLVEQGTIDAGGNYAVQVLEEYFTIEAKSINSSDVGLVTIGNQRYTGEEVKPAITLRYGTRTLVEGTDFKATYTNNVQPGQATVKLTGMGNYTGERETSFRILNISSGVDPTSPDGGSSGYSSYGYSGFDDGEGESPDDYVDEEDEDIGKLILNGSDYGVILYDAFGMPSPFTQAEEDIEPEEGVELEGEETAESDVPAVPLKRLTIIADPLTNVQTGETLTLDDGEREQYDELHLRISPALAQTLIGMNYSEIVYEVENAEMHIPLESLPAEIELEQAPEAEVISIIEGEENEEGEAEENIEELEMELAPTTLQVDAYDFMIEQSEVAMLSEREITQLNSYDALVPAYVVHTRAVFASDGTEPAAPVELGPDGQPMETLPEAERIPEGGYPQGLVLHVQPLEDMDETPTNAIALFVSTIETSEDPDVVEANPAQFVDEDGLLCSETTVAADGLYGVGYPMPEGEGAPEAEEEELVEFN